MSAQTQPYVQCSAEPGSRLSQLASSYAELKAAADEAADRLKAVTDAIKLELSQAAPDAPRVELRAGATAFRLTYSETWRFDSTRFKKEDPETYVRYAKKSGSWTLRAVSAEGDGA